MKKLAAFSVLTLAWLLLLWMPSARTAANDVDEIRQLLDRWTTAFHARDLNGIMSIYEPGQALVSYDIVAPLQYTGFEAYKKDYQEFLDQFQSPIDIEIRDLSIVAGDDVAFSHSLNRISGTMKNGRKTDLWLRWSAGYRKSNDKWRIVHLQVSVPADLGNGKAMLDLKP